MALDLAGEAMDVGVFIRDVPGCLRFYSETLGLPKQGEVTFPGGRIQHRFHVGKTLLKLMEFTEGAPPAGPRDRMAQSGIRYLTVKIRNLRETVAALEAQGVPVPVPVREARPGVWIAMVEDPDGNTIELLSE
jgi:catechol 2,3-dioxygenase-like lactoylglutathione lyase family enzyme